MNEVSGDIMTEHKEIKGILFDSGDTLVHPIGGKWWPGAQFHEILDTYNMGSYHGAGWRARLKREYVTLTTIIT